MVLVLLAVAGGMRPGRSARAARPRGAPPPVVLLLSKEQGKETEDVSTCTAKME